MSEDHKESGGTATPVQHGHGNLIARLTWALIGPLVWLGLLVPVAQGPGWATRWDAAFVGAMALMVWGRYSDQKSGEGTTIYGEPSTWTHFRHYAIRLVALSAAVWIAVKLVGKQLNGR